MRAIKTITITTWKRPHYLRQALDSLRVANPTGYTLVCGVEPGDDETRKLCESIDWMPTVVHKHPKRKGVRDNPFFVLNDVFGRMGSDMNIYLEEDIVVSPDAIAMAEWYWAMTAFDPARWLSLNYFHPGSRADDVCGLMESKNFNALGMVLTRESWEKWFRPNWFNDARAKSVHGKSHFGWDWCMTATLALEKQLFTVTPILSRSNHIGRVGGVHASPEFHDKNFGHIVLNTDPSPGRYVLRARDGSIVPYVI